MKQLDKIIKFFTIFIFCNFLLQAKVEHIIDVGSISFDNSSNKSNKFDNVDNVSKDSKYYQRKYSDFYYRPWSNGKLKIIKLSFVKNVLYSLSEIDNTTNKAIYKNGSYTSITKKFLNDIVYNMNLENIGKLNKKSIIIAPTNLKYLPTDVPFNSKRSGYFFDYNQNYPLSLNEPVLLSHYSKDGEWAFVETSYSAGWVRKERVAYISDEILLNWKNSRKAISVIDDYDLLSSDTKAVIYRTRIGDRFPIAKITKDYYLLLIATSKDPSGFANYKLVKVDKEKFITNYLKLNNNNFNALKRSFLNSNVKFNYRGKDESRDSLVLVRAFYSLFGVWLPANPEEVMIVGDKVVVKINSYDYFVSSVFNGKSVKSYLTLAKDDSDNLYIVIKNSSKSILTEKDIFEIKYFTQKFMTTNGQPIGSAKEIINIGDDKIESITQLPIKIEDNKVKK